MRRVIATSLSPNIQSDDIWLTLKQFFQPWNWRHGSYGKQLEELFKKQLGRPHAFAFSSGRSALHAALKALDLQSGDEVLLQAFTCVAVPAPILWAGVQPVYVDCDEQTFTMSPEDLRKKITSRSTVLIIQHTFGHPADLAALCSIAREHGLVVIEDCAHAYGSTYQQKPLGTFGDISFFCFGRDKAFSPVFGSVLACSRNDLAEQIHTHRPIQPAPFWWIAQQLFHPLLFSIALPVYGWGIGKILLEIAKHLHLISMAVEQKERGGESPAFIAFAMPNVLACLALHQLSKMNRYIDHRKKLVEYYRDSLISSSFILPVDHPGEQAVYLRYPIRHARSAEILKCMKQHGILLGDWYRYPIAPHGVREDVLHYTRGSCPMAEKLTTETFNLPTHINISQDDAAKIVHCLKMV